MYVCASYSCSICITNVLSKTRAGPERQKGGELACGKAEGIKQVQIPNCFIKGASTRSSVENTAPSRSKKKRRKNRVTDTAPIVP